MERAIDLVASKPQRSALIDPKIAEQRGHIVKKRAMECWLSSPASWMQCTAQSGMIARNTHIPKRSGSNFVSLSTPATLSLRVKTFFGDGVNVAARGEGLDVRKK